MQICSPLSISNVCVLQMLDETYIVRRINDNLTGLIVHDHENHTYRLTVPYVAENGEKSFLHILLDNLVMAIHEMDAIKFNTKQN